MLFAFLSVLLVVVIGWHEWDLYRNCLIRADNIAHLRRLHRAKEGQLKRHCARIRELEKAQRYTIARRAKALTTTDRALELERRDIIRNRIPATIAELPLLRQAEKEALNRYRATRTGSAEHSTRFTRLF